MLSMRGEVRPTVFVVDPQGEVIVFDMARFFARGEQGKDHCAHLMRQAARHGAKAVMLASETWIVLGAATDATFEGSLEHVPGRSEGIMLSVTSPNTNFFMQKVFTRDAEEKPVLPEGEPEFLFTATGRFLHLYPSEVEA